MVSCSSSISEAPSLILLRCTRACMVMSMARIMKESGLSFSALGWWSLLLVFVATTLAAISTLSCEYLSCNCTEDTCCPCLVLNKVVIVGLAGMFLYYPGLCYPTSHSPSLSPSHTHTLSLTHTHTLSISLTLSFSPLFKIIYLIFYLCSVGDFAVDVITAIRGYIFIQRIIMYPKRWRLRFILFGFLSSSTILLFTSILWTVYLASSFFPSSLPIVNMMLHLSVSYIYMYHKHNEATDTTYFRLLTPSLSATCLLYQPTCFDTLLQTRRAGLVTPCITRS